MRDDMPALSWCGSALRVLDQTRLPTERVFLEITTVDGLIGAIDRAVISGAPVLAIAGAYGVAVALLQAEREGWGGSGLDAAVDRIRSAGPVAVDLRWSVDRVRSLIPAGADAVVRAADAIAAEQAAAEDAIGANGADHLSGHLLAGRSRLRVLTHGGVGPPATAGRGTALGVIRELNDRGLLALVHVDETRPLLQGSRMTAWELARAGIAHAVQPDGAAASVIATGLVDAAVVGADRIAANGDVAAGAGTLAIALACADAGAPFVVAAPAGAVDAGTPNGAAIALDLRPEEEVLSGGGHRITPRASRAYNPAFEVVPARLVSALVTEYGAYEVARGHVPAAR
ncbi:S-methyl-5-thioribose-1-phosphate isomerase [Nocardiopsis sediminis]|uniref:S-methyl-5-thioribose-1-phosphate isomerase n=1 Tax=Nocardiopsis sediminis TaxID=1778267 RepID=A0ABV8FMU1_9ACTN